MKFVPHLEDRVRLEQTIPDVIHARRFAEIRFRLRAARVDLRVRGDVAQNRLRGFRLSCAALAGNEDALVAVLRTHASVGCVGHCIAEISMDIHVWSVLLRNTSLVA